MCPKLNKESKLLITAVVVVIVADALLNLLNELRKSDKMPGLSRVLSLFCKEFKK